MIRYTVTVTPHSSLYIGGYAHALGTSDGDTANDAQGMLIPGSVVKGALREAAVRLVNAATGPLGGDRGGEHRGQEVLRNLFGDAENEGVLRVGPLRCEQQPDLSLRHHVSLDRATRQAAPGRLFQNRVTAAGYALCFCGELTVSRKLEEDEKGFLESTRRITDQLGGGRGRGLGLISMEITEEDSDVGQAAPADQQPEAQARSQEPPFEKGGQGGFGQLRFSSTCRAQIEPIIEDLQ